MLLSNKALPSRWLFARANYNRKANNILKLKFSSSSGERETHTTTISGGQITINYIKTGDGPKTLFCWPGALGTIWSDFRPQLIGDSHLDKTKFTVIAWDPPGYGGSRPPNHRSFAGNFYETDADKAYEFLKVLNVEKLSLLGWSDGAVSSMIFAAKYPQIMDKLVIWGANAYITAEDIRLYNNVRDLSKWSDKMKAPMIELYGEKGLYEMWNAWQDSLELIYKNGGNICKHMLKDITCPTLILHGDQDQLVAAEHPDYLVANIKNVRLRRFSQGKHNVHMKYAKEFNRIVSDFVLE